MYETCRDIKQNTSPDLLDDLVDGFYFVKLQNGVGVQVYCTGMSPGSSETPKEFLHFPVGRSSNYGEVYRYVGSDQSCTLEDAPEQDHEGYGKTEYEKVLFDPRTRIVTNTDSTFGTTTTGKTIHYADAGDKHSYSPSCAPFGKFSIDLTATPWVVNNAMTWKWEGTFANGDNTMGAAVLDSKMYLGCYIDQSSRDLPEAVWNDNSVYSETCRKHCSDSGFEYAGTQVRRG
ncbi:A disintegrin and metalloproteinase with thrombospondin motifs 9-like [Ciona intestinalis]